MTKTADSAEGVLAWEVLRRLPEYREAWERAAAGRAPALEPGPFRIRVQAEADLGAARFEMLAWEDPSGADGDSLPFWRQQRMIEGRPDPSAPPLAGMAAEGASVDGLRLRSGGLVVRVRAGGAAVQVLVADPGPFPDGAGIAVTLPFGLGMPYRAQRLVDFWTASGRAAPRTGRGRRDWRTGRSGFWR